MLFLKTRESGNMRYWFSPVLTIGRWFATWLEPKSSSSRSSRFEATIFPAPSFRADSGAVKEIQLAWSNFVEKRRRIGQIPWVRLHSLQLAAYGYETFCGNSEYHFFLMKVLDVCILSGWRVCFEIEQQDSWPKSQNVLWR